MELVKIKGHQELRKDPNTGALLLVDTRKKQEYMAQKQVFKNDAAMGAEINTLKETIMAVEYTIHAYSPTANQEVRQFNLEGGVNNPHLTEQIAQQWAAGFAVQLNNQGYLQTYDWTPRVKYEELGIQTITGYIPKPDFREPL